MPSLKPWYKIVTPREDLREGKPLDAAEFAVHLDQVRDGRAPTDCHQVGAALGYDTSAVAHGNEHQAEQWSLNLFGYDSYVVTHGAHLAN